jgi:hypothetical protein
MVSAHSKDKTGCRNLRSHQMVKGKGKVTFHGAISTLRPPGSMTSGSIVFFPLTSSSRIHLQRRHASCRCARPPPAKVGNIPSTPFSIRAAIPEKLMGSLTCHKAGTWDIFYFPSEGRHTEDLLDARKIQRLRPGLNPRTRVPVPNY